MKKDDILKSLVPILSVFWLLLIISSYVKAVKAPDTTPPDTTIIEGPSGTIYYNDVRFSWTGTDDVTDTSDLLYSHKLEGYDADWSEYSVSTTAKYKHLPNGSYTFYVKAKDEAGNVDPSPASQSFTIRQKAMPWLHLLLGDD